MSDNESEWLKRAREITAMGGSVGVPAPAQSLDPLRSGTSPDPTLLAYARAAVEAAQEVIGQCDCIMAETSQGDPKAAWRAARDEYVKRAALRGEPPASQPERCEHGVWWADHCYSCERAAAPTRKGD